MVICLSSMLTTPSLASLDVIVFLVVLKLEAFIEACSNRFQLRHLPSFVLGASGSGLLAGTIRRLKLLTRSRNDNDGDGGGCGRCGNG